jgi:hypothetical protein
VIDLASTSVKRSATERSRSASTADTKEGETLDAEDARRLIFQTLLVMYEVDHLLDERKRAPR